MNIQRPTLILNEGRAKRNILNMAQKAKQSGVRLRPHFKTHQTLPIGEWFKKFHIDSITVSSVDMATHFAEEWGDITIAFPTNIREIAKINALAKKISSCL